MALPSSGPLSMSAIAAELGVSPTPMSLYLAESGFYAAINTSSPTYPDGVSPNKIVEWYGYNHSASSFDADAQAFITAASITDPTQQSAINTLVVTLKGYGIWNQMFAIYPFVGGNAASHKWNLKNPLDTDAAFRLVFYGGLTHSSTGILPNGTTGYADTFFIPSVHVNTTDFASLGIYSRTNSITATPQVDMSCATLVSPNGGEFGIFAGYSTTDKQASMNSDFTQPSNFTHRRAWITNIANSSGFWAASQNSSTMYLQRNGASVSPTLDVKLANRVTPNNKLVIFAQRYQASTLRRFTIRELAFSFIGKKLTDTQLSNYYTAVQAFQTTLGRQL